MKPWEVIRKQIDYLQTDLIICKRQHNNLNQIDMLSADGNRLREKINMTKGMILALEWIVQEDMDGWLCEIHYMGEDQ
jgi:hypothetical protein